MYRYLVLACVLFVCCNGNSESNVSKKGLGLDLYPTSIWVSSHILVDHEYDKHYIVVRTSDGSIAITPRLTK